ncbi:NRAMP family divalent metal transporter [Alienimonas californiensis]|uniref:Manganese transport protein MntH n=1 Tax=Alienimonas californiensis TaxID=2527989 RepID=A0A517PC19_9PLAN|nr:divalent metal cation transporter [Alienimonas californiensis]QDT16912.1 manganese transport protein MntH [Alienimonas californiensis]
MVLGPGSILTASQVGAASGSRLLWVLVFAAAVMAGTVALAARVGAALAGSPCDELAARLGRPVAVLVGGTLFLVVVGFQSSNNFAVVTALEPLLLGPDGGAFPDWATAAILLGVNGVVVAAVLGLRGLYAKLEGLMRALVAVMAAAFLVNLAFARPSISEALRGLIPSAPGGDLRALGVPLLGLVATTFSVAGAFYQAYLVKEKGWTRADGGRASVEAVLGAAALGAMTGTILLTAAATLHGRAGGAEVASTADLARQLEPLFGGWAVAIFAIGICAGALGSFLGNALIGGTLLADGLGKGTSLESGWVRGLTVAALLTAAGIAAVVLAGGAERVTAIVVAQALTVLGGPLLAGALLYLGTCVTPRPPLWTFAAAGLGAAIQLALAVRTAWRLWESATGG